MKTLWRWAFRLLILLIVLVVAGLLLLDTIAREVIKYQIRNRTGMEAKIGKLSVGLFNPTITAENVVLYNRPEFGGSPLFEMPELFIEYDRHALMARKLHFKLIRLNLARFDVVEDKSGRLNLDEIWKHNTKSGGSTSHSTNDWKFVSIDALNLTLVGQAHLSSLKLPGKDSTLNADLREQVLNGVKGWSNLDGVLGSILLNNGALPGTVRPDDPKQYWLDRLGVMGKKRKEEAK